MKIAIHQPNFIPWIGYFYKIIKSDVFVFIDQVQFIKGSNCNRTRIKSNLGKELLVTVPVKKSKGSYQSYNEIEVDYNQKWVNKFLNLLKEHYKKSPFFENYFSFFASILNARYSNLAVLNINLIKAICNDLGIKTPLYTASELPIDFGKKNELNLQIAKYYRANIYLSGEGAKKYNDEALFAHNGIVLEYMNFTCPAYPQLGENFVPNLAIVDLLFNCGPGSFKIIQDG